MIIRMPQITLATLDELLAPITQENPCGPYLKRDANIITLKDLRQTKQQDDNAGAWTVKKKSKEDPVEQSIALCETFLKEQSKDLTVAVYYAEALTKIGGFFGYEIGLRTFRTLCETYWDFIHPKKEENDGSTRVSTFKMLQSYLDSVLKNTPVVQTDGTKKIVGFDLVNKGKNAEPIKTKSSLTQVFAKLNPEETNQLAMSLNASLEHLAAIDSFIGQFESEIGSEEGVTFSEQMNICSSIIDTIGQALEMSAEQTFAPHAGQEQTAATSQTQNTPQQYPQGFQGTGASAHAAINPNQNPIASIQDAYKMLEEVNEFLIKNDTHSPSPLLIKRALEWRKMGIYQLYRDIFATISRPDELFTLLGLKPEAQNPAAMEQINPSAPGMGTPPAGTDPYGDLGDPYAAAQAYGGGATGTPATTQTPGYGTQTTGYGTPGGTAATPATSYTTPGYGTGSTYGTGGYGTGSAYGAGGYGTGSAYGTGGYGTGSAYGTGGYGTGSAYGAGYGSTTPGYGTGTSLPPATGGRNKGYGSPGGFGEFD